MICEAEKKAAYSAVPAENAGGNVAVSIGVNWERVSDVVGNSAPLRRPKRTTPDAISSEEIAAWDAASDEAWDSIED